MGTRLFCLPCATGVRPCSWMLPTVAFGQWRAPPEWFVLSPLPWTVWCLSLALVPCTLPGCCSKLTPRSARSPPHLIHPLRRRHSAAAARHATPCWPGASPRLPAPHTRRSRLYAPPGQCLADSSTSTPWVPATPRAAPNLIPMCAPGAGATCTSVLWWLRRGRGAPSGRRADGGPRGVPWRPTRGHAAVAPRPLPRGWGPIPAAPMRLRGPAFDARYGQRGALLWRGAAPASCDGRRDHAWRRGYAFPSFFARLSLCDVP